MTDFGDIVSTTQNSAVQHTSSIVSRMDSAGLRTISTLRDSPTGALTLQTLREDGLMASQTITRLPKWVMDSGKAVVLNDLAGEDNCSITVLVNRAPKSFESHKVGVGQPNVPSELQLPLVLERHRETIPTFVGEGHYSTVNGLEFLNRPLKRLGCADGGTETKRRAIEH